MDLPVQDPDKGCLKFMCQPTVSCYNISLVHLVYLSFILETQTASKWINKDWAKNWQWVCLFCGACWPPLCTDSQSVSKDWVMERGSKAGRTLMGVMLMSSEPINKLSLPLPSPLISSLVCLTPLQVRWGKFSPAARKPQKTGCNSNGWKLIKF